MIACSSPGALMKTSPQPCMTDFTPWPLDCKLPSVSASAHSRIARYRPDTKTQEAHSQTETS